MKKQDFLFIILVVVVFLPFFLSDAWFMTGISRSMLHMVW